MSPAESRENPQMKTGNLDAFFREKCLTKNTEEPPKQEEPKRVSKAEVLRDRVQQAKEAERRIVPQGMTYGEYLQYLKGKRQQLEGKLKKG